MFLSDTSLRERLISGDNLSQHQIIKKLEAGHIVMSPFPDEEELHSRIGPCSLDLQLGDTIQEAGNPRISITDDKGEKSIVHRTVDFRIPSSLDQPDATEGIFKLEPNSEFVLEPKALVRAVTREFIGIPADLIGFVHSRSKCGRYGISSSYDAPKIDPGWVGQIVLEISNMGQQRFSLHPGLLICQILFTQLDRPARNPYYSRPQSSWRWQTQP
ncbi:dCTP deaminase [Patescibacteria group bacterium]|nr:dCTP deaminase [Patescibacteria group bacterium]